MPNSGLKMNCFNSYLNLNTKNIQVIYNIYSRTSHIQKSKEQRTFHMQSTHSYHRQFCFKDGFSHYFFALLIVTNN